MTSCSHLSQKVNARIETSNDQRLTACPEVILENNIDDLLPRLGRTLKFEEPCSTGYASRYLSTATTVVLSMGCEVGRWRRASERYFVCMWLEKVKGGTLGPTLRCSGLLNWVGGFRQRSQGAVPGLALAGGHVVARTYPYK